MIRKDDGNLFAAISIRFTFSPNHRGNLLSHRSEDFVSHSVSVMLVKVSEVVDINHHEADRRIIALSISDLRKIGIKLPTLEYSRDRVDELPVRCSFASLVGENGSEV